MKNNNLHQNFDKKNMMPFDLCIYEIHVTDTN